MALHIAGAQRTRSMPPATGPNQRGPHHLMACLEHQAAANSTKCTLPSCRASSWTVHRSGTASLHEVGQVQGLRKSRSSEGTANRTRGAYGFLGWGYALSERTTALERAACVWCSKAFEDRPGLSTFVDSGPEVDGKHNTCSQSTCTSSKVSSLNFTNGADLINMPINGKGGGPAQRCLKP